MGPAQETKLLYEHSSNNRHDFRIILEDWNVPHDSIDMHGDDFPYLRDALVTKCIEEGIISEE